MKLDVGNINLVVCGSESIKSVPLVQNYEFINVGKKVSWDYSYNLIKASGRLPLLEEVREIIANMAGQTFYSTDSFSTKPLLTSTSS